jgi:phosphatidate cytidylyltransferase
LVTAICAGFVAQVGDFFESLLKRVADVKDSGGIMPGHGGVLDRLDGVLFAAPIVMIVASLFESL